MRVDLREIRAPWMEMAPRRHRVPGSPAILGSNADVTMELTTQLRLMFLAGLVGVAAVALGAGRALSWLRERGTRRFRSLLPRARPVAEGAANPDMPATFRKEAEGERPRGRASRAA
jgi:hypothetical protein